MKEVTTSITEAQARAERIRAFKQELVQLEDEGVLLLSHQQQLALSTHHDSLLSRFVESFDIDTSNRGKKLSLGMKAASLFGALAMAASLFFLFYQFWGFFSTWSQVAILMATPILLFLASLKLADIDRLGYFAKIGGMLCLAGFFLNLSMLGQIFNITPSPNAFLIWSAFGLLLAYACRARVLLFFAIMLLAGFISMTIATWSGIYWLGFGERPEHFLPAGLIIFTMPLGLKRMPHAQYLGFATIYRTMGAILVFLPILVLANWGQGSYLPWSAEWNQGLYQVFGFVLAALGIWIGIKQRWSEVTNASQVFLILYLFTKFFDWWWDWMPKYLFFFLLALSSILALLIFRRLRMTGNIREATQ